MNTQEVLTQLFNAISLGFVLVLAMDFSREIITLYKKVFVTSVAPKNTHWLSSLPVITTPQALLQLPDPWSLPLEESHELPPVKLVQTEKKHLRLLPQAKETSMAVAPQKEELLLGINMDKLKLRQARKIAKVLGIAQKVNGKDQKLDFLRSQIKLKLQQANSDIVQAVKLELIAC